MIARSSARVGQVVFFCLSACLVVSGASPAQEVPPPADPAPVVEEGPGLTPSVTVGALEVVGIGAGLDGHLGVYATLGFGLTIPVTGTFSLIPSVGFEFCPEFGSWGGTVFLTFDVLLHEGQGFLLTLDPYLGLIHDAVPDGEGDFDHNLLLGGGVGVSLIAGKVILSPSLGVYADSRGNGVVLTPTLLFSVPF